LSCLKSVNVIKIIFNPDSTSPNQWSKCTNTGLVFDLPSTKKSRWITSANQNFPFEVCFSGRENY